MFWDKKEGENGLPDLPPQRQGLPQKDSKITELGSRQNLPSFPDSATHKGFSQSAIKDAVNPEEDDDGLPELPSHDDPMDPGKSFKTVEMEEWAPGNKQSQPRSQPPQAQFQPKSQPQMRPPETHSQEAPPESHHKPNFHHELRSPHPHPYHSDENQEPASNPAPPVQQRDTTKFVPKQDSNVPDVFVKIDKFHIVKKSLNEVKENLSEIDEMLKKIREIKMREEQELSSWEKQLTGVKARLSQVTETIFEKVE